MTSLFRTLGWTMLLCASGLAGAEEATIPASKPSIQTGEVLRLIEPHGKADLEKMDQRVYRAAANLARYLRTLVHPWNEDSALLLLTNSRSDEHHIRPNTGAVHGFCFLCRFGPYEESVVGVSRSRLLGETSFASTQTDLLSSLATSWLVLKLADRIERAPRDRVGVRRLESGKIILRRTGSAVHTVSWGPKVMAQCVPYRLDRMISPDQANGIGQVALKDQQKSLPIRLREVNVASGEDWFKTELVVDHGEHVRAELVFASNQDGSFTMRETLVALVDATTTRIATGQIGILNNPGWVYERGRRTVAIDGREEVVPALSGKTVQGGAGREVAVDGVLHIRGTQPLRIRYVGATQPSRSRATDLLYLNFDDREHSWRAGQTVSEYDAVIYVAPSK